MTWSPRRLVWIVAGMALLYAPAALPVDDTLDTPRPDAQELTAAVLAPTVEAAVQPASPGRLAADLASDAAPPAGAGAPVTLAVAIGLVVAIALVWVEAARPDRRHAHRGPPSFVVT